MGSVSVLARVGAIKRRQRRREDHVHASRFTRCRNARERVGADDPKELHRIADAIGIPERCRLILSDPLKTVASELFPVVALPPNPNAQSNKIHPIRDRK